MQALIQVIYNYSEDDAGKEAQLMATICTHIVDGAPVTEVVEDGVARPYDPAEFETRVVGSGTETAPAPSGKGKGGRKRPGDRAAL